MAKKAVDIVRKRQIAESLASKSGITLKAATAAVDFVFDTLGTCMSKGTKVAIQDFGIFVKAQRKARTGRNPATGETIKIKASVKPRFTPAKALKEAIAGQKYALHCDEAALVVATSSPTAPKKTVKKVTAKKTLGKKEAKKVAKKAAKKVAKKAVAKKAVAKKAAKKVVAKKAVAKKAAKKVVAKKAVAKKAAKKVVAKKATVKKAAAKKTVAKKVVAKKAAAKKTVAKKATAKKASCKGCKK